jgi:hypothetical protein
MIQGVKKETRNLFFIIWQYETALLKTLWYWQKKKESERQKSMKQIILYMNRVN